MLTLDVNVEEKNYTWMSTDGHGVTFRRQNLIRRRPFWAMVCTAAGQRSSRRGQGNYQHASLVCITFLRYQTENSLPSLLISTATRLDSLWGVDMT
jgi:hypothetical protein